MSPASPAVPSTILITGAGTGFGRGATELLLGRGHRVLAGVQNAEQAAALAPEVAQWDAVEIVELDLERPDQIAAVAERDIDILVNNAGFGSQGPIVDTDLAKVRKAFEVNVFGSLDLTQRVIKQLQRRKAAGRIVFVSSVAGLFVGPGAGAYTMSKHALDAMAIELQQEFSETDISVHILNPGPHQTGFNEQLVGNAPAPDPAAHQRLLSAQADPASAIALLANLADGTESAARVVTPERFIDVALGATHAKLGRE